MMNKILYFLLFVMFFSCKKESIIIEEYINNPPESESAETIVNSDKKPLKIVSPSDTVFIFVRQDGAPGMYLGDDGEVHGFYVDLEKMVMNHMNQSYEFIPYSDVGPAVQALKTGTHHSALAVPDLPDYRALTNLSKPYEVLQYITFVRGDNINIKGFTKEEIIRSLHGKKVGVQTQGHIYQVLRDIKEINLIQYPTTTKALEDLNLGNIDAVPDVKRIGIYYSKMNNWNLKYVGKPIMSQKITTGFSKIFDKSLLNRYNNSLTTLISDGSVQKLWESYYGPMGAGDKP